MRGRGLRPSAAALDEAVAAIHPYPRWVATTGAAGLAGALALLLGSPWVAVLAAAAVTAVIDVTGRYLAKRRLPAGEDADMVEMFYTSADFREGVTAFLAKRKPVWTGK